MKPIGAEEFPVLSKNSLFRPKKFPVPAKKFPVLSGSGNWGVNHWRCCINWRQFGRNGLESEKFPVKFPVLREFGEALPPQTARQDSNFGNAAAPGVAGP